MLDLSALKFSADTSELERAGRVIGNLATDMSKLDKASRDAAQTEAILAKAAKANADANLQNAKAQDVRLKSTIAADKADKQAVDAVEKKSKAVEKNTSILERNKTILEFQTQGYSKGQASVLAYGKAAGLAADEISELGKVLETQRKLMGGDPFDKSLSGIKSLQNQYTELKESVRQYNTDSNLSAKQTRELARDKERLIEKMKVEGASFQDIRKAVRAHNEEYVGLAKQYNKLASAEDNVIRQRKELVQATNYVTQADQKMAAALNTTNSAIDKAGTDSLVKYENALRKSGISQELATQKLANYKTQLQQVSAVEEKRKAANLARALQPQFTDIGVSLWSGQSPLTVLLQQSGQMVDLFKLSGVEAQNLGKVMKEAFASMIPAIGVVAKGLGSLVVESFLAAGTGITRFISDVTGISTAVDMAKRAIVAGGEENFKYIASLQKFGAIAGAVAASGFAALLAVLVALAVALKQVTDEQNELARTLNLTGASLGMNAAGVVAFAQSLEGVRTSEAISFINELSKASVKGGDNIKELTKVAVDLEKYGGVALKETAKAYDDLQNKPLEGLLKVAEGTGQVSAATIDMAVQAKLAGDEAKLLALAQDEFVRANAAAVESIKAEINPMTALWITIKDGINFAWEGLKNFARTGAVLETIASVFKVLANYVVSLYTGIRILSTTLAAMAHVAVNVRDAINPFSGVSISQTVSNMTSAFDSYKQSLSDISADTAAARLRINEGQEKSNQLTAEAKAANSDYATGTVKGMKELEKAYGIIEKSELKKISRQQAINKATEDFIQLNKNASAEQQRIIAKAAGIEWDKANKAGANKQAKQDAKDLETEIDLRNKALGLLGTFNNELDAIERRRAKTGDESEYQKSLNALIEKQPIYLERQKEINTAHDLANKLMGKAEGLGKDYYKTLEQIQKFQDEGLYSPEKAETLRQAAFDQTQLAKEQLKYVEDSSKAYSKYREEVQKSFDSSVMENRNLDDRLELLGLTSEQQKQLKIQQQQRNALLGVDLKLTAQIAKIWQDVREGKIDPFDAMQAQMDAEKAAAEERKNINKEVAVQAAEDFAAEFRQIKAGITDSIVTALFEGGKAGSKKLRDVLVSVLRQKVTMVVDVGVNAFMNSLMGGFFGGGSAGGASGGGLGDMMNLASSANSAYSLYSGGFGGTAVGQAYAGYTGATIPASMVGPSATPVSMWSNLGNTAGTWGSGASGGATAGGTGTLAGAGIFAAIALAIGNALGVFRTDTLNGSGLMGTLGGGKDLQPWEEWREGGTLFDGPSFSTMNPVEELKKAKEKLAELTAAQAAGTLGNPQQLATQQGIVDELEKTYGGLAASVSAQSKAIQSAYTSMRDGAVKMAESLGLGTDKIKDFTTLLGGEKGIDFKDKNPQEQQALIAEALATANNELAQQVLGTWETTSKDVSRVLTENIGSAGEDMSIVYTTLTDTVTETKYIASEYAKEGEKAIDTLTRLSSALMTVNQTFDTLGYTMLEASLASGDLASKLVEAFGGIANFTASTSYFYENFYSEADRSATAVRQLTQVFADNNIAMPKTREEFKKLVAGINTTTDEGRKLYATVMGLAPAFVSITKSQEDLLKAEEDRLQEAFEAHKQQQRDILNVQIDLAQKQVDIYQRLFDFLNDEVKKLYGSVESTSAMQAAEGRAIITKAQKTGKLPELEVLQDAVGAVTGSMSSNKYASKFDMERDKLRFAAQLDDLRDTADKNLKSAKNTFDLLKLQLEQLDQLNITNINQLDVLRSIDDSIKNGTGGTGTGGVGGIGGKPVGNTVGGGTTPTAGRGVTPRADYGADEALTSFEKFKVWYNGIRYNADPSVFNGANGYETPDWMRVHNGADDGTDKEMFGSYLFYKNNPQYAKDFEKVYATGKSDYATDGSTLVRSDLSKMPKEIAEYFKNDYQSLLSYEAFGMDPVLGQMMFASGPEQFGIDGKKTNLTEWLKDHKWTENGIIENNNQVDYSNMEWKGMKLPRWDTSTGNIVDLDGKIYKPGGEFVGNASRSQMEGIYGKGFLSQFSAPNKPGKLNSSLYDSLVTSGSTSEESYYNDVRANLDKAIADGWSAQQLADAVRDTGASLQDVATAYGISVSQVVDNLKAGGATDIPAFAKGGQYNGGAAIVGEEGPELINFNQGGYIHTASQTSALLSQESVIASLNRLNARVEMMEAAARSTAVSNNKIAKLLDRICPNGDAMNTVDVTPTP